MRKPIVAALSFSLAMLAGCEAPSTAPKAAAPVAEQAPVVAENPFFAQSSLQFHYPNFDLISNEHYAPAFERVGSSIRLSDR